MNIREAILKAADHIERHPKEFNFYTTNTPDGPGCGTPGCAIGWTAHFMGVPSWSTTEVSKWFGVDSDVFYKQMDDLLHDSWQETAADTAIALRLYADKYHPETVLPPDWNAIANQRTVTPDAVSQEASFHG